MFDTSLKKRLKWLKTTFRLAFLNPREVSESFVEDFMPIIPERSAYYKYVDYLTDNYISENNVSPNNMVQF